MKISLRDCSEIIAALIENQSLLVFDQILELEEMCRQWRLKSMKEVEEVLEEAKEFLNKCEENE